MESIEDEALRESPAAEITAFAAEIQDTVSGRDLEALAELCDFPISVANAGRNFPDRQFPGRFYYSWEGVRVHKKSGT